VLKTIYDDDYRSLTERLVRLREDAGLTQRQLARRLKWPQSIVARIETAERRLDVLEFVTWCKALKANPAKLLSDVFH
jgi:transcriptional regulator with XRE-family HTH domain